MDISQLKAGSTSTLVRYRTLLILILLVWLSSSRLSVTGAAPSPAVEAWCMIYQVIQNIQEFVRSHQLAQIHNEDGTLSIAVSTLIQESENAKPETKTELQTVLSTFGRRVGELHVAADLGQQDRVELLLPEVLDYFQKLQTYYDAATLDQARLLSNRYTCSMHPDVIGKKGEECPKCGMLLDQMVRPAPFRPGAVLTPVQTVRAKVSYDGEPQAGKELTGWLRLSKLTDQLPITPDDLFEMHTQKVHLFIIDPSLSDYHHEHPIPTETPGQYVFHFTPAITGPYRVWADVRPTLMGFQEYAMADIVSSQPGQPLVDKKQNLISVQKDFKFELEFAQLPLKADHAVSAKLRIKDSQDKPVSSLEPVMGAFAHLVGFYEDYKTIIHMHPKGAVIQDPKARGGPELEFVFYAPKPGFIRLFSQIQWNGTQVYAPFGLDVLPPDSAP
jgi:hypothetical protein